MIALSFTGDIDAALDTFADTFIGGVSVATGTGISSSAGAPFASSMSGSGLFFALTGNVFLNGQISGFRLAKAEIPTGGGTLSFETQVEARGVSFQATELFAFVARTSTQVIGEFQSDVFRAELNGGQLEITGSDADDNARPGEWVKFAGNDRFEMGKGADTVRAGAGKDVVKGGAGRDKLLGEAGADRLFGGGGRDKLNGGTGDDFLSGQGGRNVLKGGKGADQFVFSGAGRDRIVDFEDDVDILRLDSSLWSGPLSVRKVLSKFASQDDMGVLFTFDGGERLRLDDFSAIAELRDDLVIV